MMMNRVLRLLVPPLACAALASCAETRASAVYVERTDSAGIEIVTSHGEDVPLPWTFEPVLTFGGEEDGPLAFFGVGEFVRTDARGNIYVLDAGNRRVLVFDAQGRYLRSMGSRGSGPGEFEYAGGFFVGADGTATIFDTLRQKLVAWGPEGEVVTFPPFDTDRFVNPLHLAGSRILASVSVFPSESGGNRLELHLIDGGERRVVAGVPAPAGFEERREISFANCPVRLFGVEPILSARILVAGFEGGAYASTAVEYELAVLIPSGEITRLVRRDRPVRRATVEDAAAEIQDTTRIRFGTEECRIPATDYVESMGFAEWVPSIRQIRAAPDGTLWVNRSPRRAEGTQIDVFSPTGEYLGTLPPETPFPAAFTPSGEIITVEKDEFDLERVVMYRVVLD